MDTNPAQLRPPPTEPPTLCSREEQQQWFADMRVWNGEITQYAVGITRRHFAGAGLELRTELENSKDWNGFALYLSLALGPVIDQTPKAEWVKALIVELVDFSLLNPSGSPVARLAQLLAQFIQWDLQRRWAFKALLPEKADAALELIREWEAEEQRRIDEAYW
ncbi:MAG: hypothetical protein QOG27_1722 [Verrucomicrobiota bacterium]|jgi:hypothetical protein